MGKLVVNTGSMFSGKSTELQRQGERHLLASHKVQFIKPNIDNRYGDNEIVSHKGVRVNAQPVSIDDDIKFYISEYTQVVLIDEIQFFNNRIVEDIRALLMYGITVYCSGLDMDYLGQPFEVVASLMCMADEVNKFHAVCSHCGTDAVYSAKYDIHASQRFELGEKDKYIPLCRKCYYKFMGWKTKGRG